MKRLGLVPSRSFDFRRLVLHHVLDGDTDIQTRYFSFLPEDRLKLTEGVHISRRGERVLVVEPVSAKWTILAAPKKLLQSLKEGVLLGDFFRGAGPEERGRREIMETLYSRGMLSVNGFRQKCRGPIPYPEKYPMFFSLHMAEGCNFNCNYCYMDAALQGQKMSAETARLIIKRIARDLPIKEFTLEFHGGEPLLNFSVIRETMEFALHEAKRYFKRVDFSMQTNGSLIKDEVLTQIKGFPFSLGVSLDGPEMIHNRNRIFPNGKGTFRSVMKGLDLARAAGLDPGVIVVVDDPTTYIETCKFLFSKGVTKFRLNPMACQGRAGTTKEFDAKRPAKFVEEYLKLIDFLVSYKQENPEVFVDIWNINIYILHLMTPYRPFMCARSPCGAGNAIMGFSHEGDVYPCDEFVGRPEFRLGNIRDPGVSLAALIEEHPLCAKLQNRTIETLPKCKACPWRNFCGGGCAAKANDHRGDAWREDPMCEFFSGFYEELAWKIWDDRRLLDLLGQYRRYVSS
ncbi:MAG: radical SAM protein [Armatimonadetes bacterium]|nr:radical SAM protein [Armatimonadota bacterium]